MPKRKVIVFLENFRLFLVLRRRVAFKRQRNVELLIVQCQILFFTHGEGEREGKGKARAVSAKMRREAHEPMHKNTLPLVAVTQCGDECGAQQPQALVCLFFHSLGQERQFSCHFFSILATWLPWMGRLLHGEKFFFFCFFFRRPLRTHQKHLNYTIATKRRNDFWGV